MSVLHTEGGGSRPPLPSFCFIFMVVEVLVIYFFLLFSLVLGLLVFLVSYLFVPRYSDFEKISVYECGFEPFEETRAFVDINFYLVGILFVVFDVELIYMVPVIYTFEYLSVAGFITLCFFLFLVFLGFFFEWLVGALKWV